MQDRQTAEPPDWMVEALARAETQIEAGQTVPLDDVFERGRASLARMKVPAAQLAQRE